MCECANALCTGFFLLFPSLLALDGSVGLYHTHQRVGKELFNEACVLIMFMSLSQEAVLNDILGYVYIFKI